MSEYSQITNPGSGTLDPAPSANHSSRSGNTFSSSHTPLDPSPCLSLPDPRPPTTMTITPASTIASPGSCFSGQSMVNQPISDPFANQTALETTSSSKPKIKPTKPTKPVTQPPNDSVNQTVNPTNPGKTNQTSIQIKTNSSKSALKQSKPASLNSARNNPSMRQHGSKLHLIDDTTLTSLPLPPPPSTKWFRRRHSELSVESPNTVSTDAEQASMDGTEPRYQSLSELSRLSTFSDVECDDSFADSQDPIVLVEDYLVGAAEAQSEETLFRKQSLANFKKRARDDMSRCSSGTTINNSCGFAQSMDTSWTSGPKEDLEAMFGTIPGSDKLKHCTLCDKPLYEISSLMNSTVDQSHIHKLYTELVCSGCINTYQQVLDEMYQMEIHRARTAGASSVSTASGASLIKTFNSLRNVYQRDFATFMQTSTSNTQKRVKRQFSRNLIGRLQNLSELSSPQQNTSGWLKLLQDKFNWRN